MSVSVYKVGSGTMSAASKTDWFQCDDRNYSNKVIYSSSDQDYDSGDYGELAVSEDDQEPPAGIFTSVMEGLCGPN